MDVLVFKTDISKLEALKVEYLLLQIPEVLRVSFDLEDCDNILRIESNSSNASAIENLLENNGIYCRELED